MPKLLIPFDDSAPALRAVKQVVAIAGAMTGAEAVLLNVQHTDFMVERLYSGSKSELRQLEEPLRRAGEAMLIKAAALLDRAGVEHSAHVEVGDPAPLIADYAKKYHCDMIVMGTHGLGAVKSLVLGSVATKVLHLAKMPVMLVR
jgi:nucleotide-binding universal stress UspA family protein